MIYLQDVYRTKNKKFDKFYDFLPFEDREKIEKNNLFLEVLPEFLVEEFLEEQEKSLNEAKNLDKEYNFNTRLSKYKELFDSLENCKINRLALKAYNEVETNQTILSTINTFKVKNGFSSIPKYNLFSNVTGRVTIKSGPNILTLPKRNRSILESQFREGSILSLDFLTLEPRIILGILGKNRGEDIYEELNKKLDLNLDRSVIKRAIISVIYGSKKNSIEGISLQKSVELFNCINEFFELEKIYNFATSLDSFGIRRNYFGRPLWNLSEERKNILINNYVQSSAVDLALTYFSDVVKRFDKKNIKPLFILHDALIIDIEKKYIDDLKSIIGEGYKHEKLGKFPVTIDIFNKNIKDN